ncbi:MAG: biotin--[acetyl-CoA-carboxylase] ligase [Clostridia bacterium]
MALKSELLKILEQNKNIFISGQNLANQLNVSRTAIWKVTKTLKEEGHSIISINNKGYKLTVDSDKISKEGIALFLDNNYNNIPIEVFETIDSTSNEAKRRIANSTYPTAIISEMQTTGRGRYGKTFYSPSNSGIYMSLILSPNLQLENAKLITCATAICVCKAIENLTNLSPQIKWVNDILINNRKVCGILTEAITDFESGCVEKVIIGIGINCNQTIDKYPTELRNIVGSLPLLPISRNQLIASIINNILSEIFIAPKEIIKQYKERSMMLDKEITFTNNDLEITAKVVDINSDGNIIAVDSIGKKHIISSGIINIKGLYQ